MPVSRRRSGGGGVRIGSANELTIFGRSNRLVLTHRNALVRFWIVRYHNLVAVEIEPAGAKRVSGPFEVGREYRAQFARIGPRCYFGMAGAHPSEGV